MQPQVEEDIQKGTRIPSLKEFPVNPVYEYTLKSRECRTQDCPKEFGLQREYKFKVSSPQWEMSVGAPRGPPGIRQILGTRYVYV